MPPPRCRLSSSWSSSMGTMLSLSCQRAFRGTRCSATPTAVRWRVEEFGRRRQWAPCYLQRSRTCTFSLAPAPNSDASAALSWRDSTALLGCSGTSTAVVSWGPLRACMPWSKGRSTRLARVRPGTASPTRRSSRPPTPWACRQWRMQAPPRRGARRRHFRRSCSTLSRRSSRPPRA